MNFISEINDAPITLKSKYWSTFAQLALIYVRPERPVIY